jgi:diaminobutyrate-2-oxoglutarate transaminase
MSETANIITRLESNVRSYCRSFPAVFERAEGSVMIDTTGRRYIDFFSGAGALSYGHNAPHMKQRLLDYISANGIVHTLDMTSVSKCAFLETFERLVLSPRDLSFKVMFTGPTGTNAVEAALKLARKVTRRETVIAFTNAFHGMTLGSLAVTGSREHRMGAGVPLQHVVRMPFDGYFGSEVDTVAYMEVLLDDPSSGIDAPAAFIVETVQSEGGVNIASAEWLRRLQVLARRVGALVIVDDIQVGCGRTGPFFSFEPAGIQPDIICLSKAISGFGLPMALVLIRPDLDQWRPGEHNGTFRGNNLAFVTAAAALERFWQDDALQRQTEEKSVGVTRRLESIAARCGATSRGRGMIQALAFDAEPDIAGRVAREAFELGLIIETAGARDQVLKLLPALTIDNATLDAGLDILDDAVARVCQASRA